MSVHVVTGAGRGMGLACARRLAAAGGTLIAADVGEVDLDALGPRAGVAVAVTCDVTSPDAVAALATRAASYGPVRSLVHAAGISPAMGDASRVFTVDLVGTALVVDAFLPVMADGSAAVCFASSAAHVLPEPGHPALNALVSDPLAADFVARAVAEDAITDSAAAYGWAKRGVIRLVARSATSWGARGARINAVSPGIIDTPMGRQELEAQPMMSMVLDIAPARRMGTADDVATVVEFLLSDAASYVTGVDVVVDGGIVAVLTDAGAPSPVTADPEE